MPRVSVIIPTYNRGYIIAEALASAFAQTYPDFELVVVDDGSTDNTEEVVKRFDRPSLRYLRIDHNQGIGAALNHGVDASRGELISLLDSDDLWKPEKLASDVAFLDKHPDVDVLFSDLEKHDGQRHVRSFMREETSLKDKLAQGPYPEGLVLSPRFAYLLLLQEVPIKPTTLTLRSDFVRRIGGFNETWPSSGDWEFLMRAAKVARFGYVDRPVAVLRVMKDATHRSDRGIEGMLRVLDMLRAELDSGRADAEVVHAARLGLADITKALAWSYLDRERRWCAALAFTRGFRDTWDMTLLFRGGAALLSPRVRVALKRRLGRAGY
jgi:glycosyltransferase involved in cell wall biosynthesis